MDFPENPAEAIQNLKQAIPLTQQQKLPPSPHFYALCYVYVTGRNATLNAVLDEIFAADVPCSPALAKELYAQYIGNSEVARSAQQVASVADNLHINIDELLTSGVEVNRKLSETAASVTKVDSDSSLTEVLDAVSNTTQEFVGLTSSFIHELETSRQKIDFLKQELSDMEMRVSRDNLTGLFNRETFYKQIKQLTNTPGIAETLSLVLIDIDHFKSFNDSFGHLVGDRVLKQVGQVLAEHCVDNAVAARYAGDEFVIMKYGADIDKVVSFVERLRKSIANLKLQIRATDNVVDKSITSSFGITKYVKGESIEDFIERADQALYKVKGAGRNGFYVL